MEITVLTPDREIFSGTILSVKAPGVHGQFQVLKNHAPLVSALSAGSVEIVTAAGHYSFFNDQTGTVEKGEEKDKIIQFKIAGGFLEVLNNKVALLIRAAK